MNRFDLFQNAIKDAKNVLIVTHANPDADGIGSQIALAEALTIIKINCYCLHEDHLLQRYRYLDPHGLITTYKKYLKDHSSLKIDLTIVADTNSLDRLDRNIRNIAINSKNILFIDHHPCAKELQALHCIDISAAATGEVVGHLINDLNIPFTKEMSLALYTSIMCDTSSFRYPTVTGKTHRLIAKLMDVGVVTPYAYNKIYGAKKIEHMRLLGDVLKNSQITHNGEIAWLTITQDDIKKYNIEHDDTHAFINHLLILKNVKVALMFKELEGYVKISFRSPGEIDVGAIAQALGGGGHNFSAATTLKGDLDQIIEDIVERVSWMLSQLR